MLPPGGRNWQLIYPKLLQHSSKLFHFMHSYIIFISFKIIIFIIQFQILAPKVDLGGLSVFNWIMATINSTYQLPLSNRAKLSCGDKKFCNFIFVLGIYFLCNWYQLVNEYLSA
jgi:hypothetical protein